MRAEAGSEPKMAAVAAGMLVPAAHCKIAVTTSISFLDVSNISTLKDEVTYTGMRLADY